MFGKDLVEIGGGRLMTKDPAEMPPAQRIVYCSLHAAAEKLAEALDALIKAAAISEVNAHQVGIGDEWTAGARLLREIGR